MKKLSLFLLAFLLIGGVSAGIFASTLPSTDAEITLHDKSYQAYVANTEISTSVVIDGACEAYLKTTKEGSAIGFIYAKIRYSCGDLLTEQKILSNRNEAIRKAMNAYVTKVKAQEEVIAARTLPEIKGGDGKVIIK